MATYPGGVKSFSTKLPNQTIASAHMNEVQDEIVAIETDLLATNGTKQFSAGTVGSPSVGIGDSDVGFYSSGANALDVATNGVKALGIDSTQFIDSPTQPRAVAFHSTTQSIPNNTLTAVALDSEDVDIGTMHDLVTNNSRITVPSGGDGFYEVKASIVYAGSAGGTLRSARLRKNGTTVVCADGQVVPSAATVLTVQVSCMVTLAATDYLELIAFQDSGGALNVGGASRQLQNTLAMVKLW